MFYFQTTFLQALNSIDSFNITSGVVGVAESILLLSFLYSAYQAFAAGGDVRALAISGTKYLVLGLVFATYGTVFRDCVWQLLLAHFGGLIWPTLGRCGFGEAF